MTRDKLIFCVDGNLRTIIHGHTLVRMQKSQLRVDFVQDAREWNLNIYAFIEIDEAATSHPAMVLLRLLYGGCE